MSSGNKTSTDNKLEELRSLLRGPDKDILDELVERLKNPDARTQDVAEVLVEAIRLKQTEGDDFAKVIEQPVTESVRRSIERDSQYFASLIFPVIGPAIRKYIAEALKSFIQNVNMSVENSLSPKSFKWRLEAITTGKTFGEVMLKHTLVYRVEQVFLIENESGLLMQHVARDDVVVKDGDAVSAMFSAIQSFVQDSFGDDGDDDHLESVEVGEHSVWLTRLNGTTLACVIRGIAPIGLKSDVDTILEDIHRQYAAYLAEFDGNKATLAVLQPELQRCFQFEQTKATDMLETPKKTWRERLYGLLKTPFFYIALAILALLLWSMIVHWQERQKRDELVEKMNQIPGLLVTDLEWQSKRWYLPNRKLLVYGLQDTGFAHAQGLLGEVYQHPEESVMLHLKPYRSLEAGVVVQRVRQWMSAPESVRLTYDENTQQVYVSGDASASWYDLWKHKQPSILGVKRLDYSALQPDVTELNARYQSLKKQIQTMVLLFDVGTQPSADFTGHLDKLAPLLRRLSKYARQLEFTPEIRLVAYSDASGNTQANQSIRAYRSNLVKTFLTNRGVNANYLMEVDGGVLGEQGVKNKENRKVMLSITEVKGLQ